MSFAAILVGALSVTDKRTYFSICDDINFTSQVRGVMSHMNTKTQ